MILARRFGGPHEPARREAGAAPNPRTSAQDASTTKFYDWVDGGARAVGNVCIVTFGACRLLECITNGAIKNVIVDWMK